MTSDFRNQYLPVPQNLSISCGLLVLLLLCSLLISSVQADTLRNHPLQPVDTSSPRATLRAFMTNAANAQTEFRQSGYRSMEVMKHTQRAVSTLDLRQIATARREDVGLEATLRLKVILDNIEVPELDTIPGPEDFKATDDLFWRVPNTNITIARITEGTRRGAWLFTAETVSRLPDYYKLIREARGADQITDWVFENYTYSPGWMIPVGLIDVLPRWMRAGLFEQALWQWISLLLSIAISATILIWAWRASNWLQKKVHSDARRWPLERMIFPVFGMVLLSALLYFIDQQINITGDVLGATSAVLILIILIFASWAVLIGGEIFNQGITGIKHIASISIATDVTRLVISIISFVIVFLLFSSLPNISAFR